MIPVFSCEKTATRSSTMTADRGTIRTTGAILVACGLFYISAAPLAASIRDRIAERQLSETQDEQLHDEAADRTPAVLPANVRIVRDVAYGNDARQRFDVYSPANARGAPIIVMVHGGAWFLGDKGARAVVENKVARWVTRGFIVVSTNYRLLPKADPIEQARDVARALAAVQDHAAEWGGDRTKCILMGHSAGAHLVALLATSPAISARIVTTPWLGTVSLDSAALDVVAIMEAKHRRFYDRAFGHDPAYWRAASPYYTVTAGPRPMLMVCSSRRADSCAQANRFAAKAAAHGVRTSVLPEDLSHKEINQRLGEESSYTQAVEQFMASLDPRAAELLAGR